MQDSETQRTAQRPGWPAKVSMGAGPMRRSAFAWADKPWRLLLVPAALVAAAAAALAIDCPMAWWCLHGTGMEDLRRLLLTIEPFGNGLGVLVIVAAVHQFDPMRRWALPRVLAMSLGAGLAADVAKLLIARTRPHHFAFEGGVADTFGSWFPFLGTGNGGQSFPSAHTATAVGLAVALIWLYPRGRRLFATLAVLVACQRMVGNAHYLSDTLCGAASGLWVSMLLLKNKRIAAPLEHLERYLRTRQEQPPPSADDRQQHDRRRFAPAVDDPRRRAA